MNLQDYRFEPPLKSKQESGASLYEGKESKTVSFRFRTAGLYCEQHFLKRRLILIPFQDSLA